MADVASRRSASWEPDAVRTTVVRLAQEASVELNVQDVQHLGAMRELLRPETRVYVSHLPKQSFRETLSVCAAVRSAGFEAIHHVPVRLFESHAQLSGFIDEAVDRGVNEALLISGDYAQARGPFSCVADVFREVDLRVSGWKRISFGGHPEGHPKVDLPTIRAAELEKARLAQSFGLHATFVTQFFFEADPFLEWAHGLRSAGRSVAIRAGLAGPASVTTLFRFAVRCGVGPSIKALNTRPGSFTRLLAEHGPEEVLTRLAADESLQPSRLDGIHLFCFGGVIRTCRWLNQLASGQFVLNEAGQLGRLTP
jgi:methylenetetrahydrofolate reductase (NADPH)